MKRNAVLTILLLISSLWVAACSSTTSQVRPPDIAFSGSTIAKDVIPEGDIGTPVQTTDNLSIADEKVVCHSRFENFSGKNRVRWDWYSPKGTLYATSGDYPINTTDGKYRRVLTAWHTIKLKGEKAAALPGKWSVKVYLNNELIDTQTFMLTTTAQLALPDDLSLEPDETKWGLVIGIEEYANLPSAEYAFKDALVVKEYFIKIIGVPESNIILLTDNKATKAGIVSYIKTYLPRNVTKDTQLYVYFAGHGAPEIKKGDAYLVPYDGDTRFLESTGYALKDFYVDLNSIGNRRTYIFLDACFSGIASRAAEMLAKGTRPALLHVEDTQISAGTKNNLMSISSSSAGEPSNAYPETEHGLFTYFLLKGIGGAADDNSDGKLSVDEVYQYVSTNVSREARRMGSQQMPMMTPSVPEIKDITLANTPK